MTHTEGDRQNYEASDARARPVLVVGGLLGLLCIGGLVGSWLVLDVFTVHTTSEYEAPSPLFERELPQEAPLLIDEPRWAGERIQAQQQHLSSYGWVDHARGIAHIPIEKAMALEAEAAQKEGE